MARGCAWLLALLSEAAVCREVNKRKGEEYQLIWKDQPDFVRMAAKLNALVIPFAAVGGAPLVSTDVLGRLPCARILWQHCACVWDSVGIQQPPKCAISVVLLQHAAPFWLF